MGRVEPLDNFLCTNEGKEVVPRLWQARVGYSSMSLGELLR